MFLKYILGFIVVSSVLYANDRPDRGRAKFINTKVSFKNVNETTKPGLLSVSGNSYARGYIKRSNRGRAVLSPKPVRIEPGLYQKISLDDFGVDQGGQRDSLVKAIKSEMLRLGCYQGKIDTVWGEDIRNELETLDRGLPTLTAEKVTLHYLKKQRSLGCDGNQGWDKLTTEEKGGVRVTGSIWVMKPVIENEPQTQPETPLKRKVKIKSEKRASPLVVRKKSQTARKTKVKPTAPVKKVVVRKALKVVAVAKPTLKPALKKVADKKLVQSVQKVKAKPRKRRKRYARKKFGTHSIFGLDSF